MEVECDECNFVWLDPAKIVLKHAVYPSSYEEKRGFRTLNQCSTGMRRLATREEIVDFGWERHIFETEDFTAPYNDHELDLAVRDAIRLYDIEGLESTAEYYCSPMHASSISYLFVVDSDGYTVASPFPEMIGRDPSLRIDANGYYYGDDLLSATEEGKWITYFFHHPVLDIRTRKRTWVVRHKGLFFASGYHPDERVISSRTV